MKVAIGVNHSMLDIRELRDSRNAFARKVFDFEAALALESQEDDVVGRRHFTAFGDEFGHWFPAADESACDLKRLPFVCWLLPFMDSERQGFLRKSEKRLMNATIFLKSRSKNCIN